MDDWSRKLAELGQQHVIFQQALWRALDGVEIGLETTVGPDGVRRVNELGSIEIVNRPDGSILVRRAKPTN